MRLNSYFDGSVRSLGFETDGRTGTVGVIAPGEYSFSTNEREIVTILAGALDVELPGSPWRTVLTGDFYTVPGDSSFKVRTAGEVAYVCEFVGPPGEEIRGSCPS